ncbi:MAG TPA: hypothetical protein VLX59_00805, partial [Acidimicrobiales bacterium]|nr:hypothetical protein [Acidimicrobiales bacterium]
IAGDGIVTAQDVARELGLRPLPFPVGIAQRAARLLAAAPTPRFLPPLTEWVEAASHPVIIDCTKARRDLGWRPRYSALEALRTVAAAPSSQPASPPSRRGAAPTVKVDP